MKIFVAGSAGQLARALVDCAGEAGIGTLALGRPQLDLARRQGAEQIEAFAPDVIVNAAAYTAVDAPESDSARAFSVNRDGAAWLAGIAARRKTPFLHISSDYVFDGAKATAYTEADPPNPQTAYGRTKRAGEEVVLAACPEALIFRTAWVFSPYGQNFVKTMLRLASERESLRVVNDQTGNPTSAHDVAKALLIVARRLVHGGEQPRGIFHLAATGETTWFEFARAIMQLAAEHRLRAVPVTPIASAEYPTAAKRPANSRLDCKRFAQEFGLSLPRWQDGLAATMRALAAERTGAPARAAP
jgi:dTDP-4-dehydrorhamnose reductase